LFLFEKQTNQKLVKQEVNGTVILPPLVFIGQTNRIGPSPSHLNSDFKAFHYLKLFFAAKLEAGNTKGGSITVPLTSCLTVLDKSVLQIKTKIISCHTADSKPFKQEVNGTVILPPLVFPEIAYYGS
jgi:hypothetical protein